jgi:hypothetical protein
MWGITLFKFFSLDIWVAGELGRLNKGSIPLIISTFVERIFYRIFYLFISYKSTNLNGRSYFTIQPNK